MASATSSHVSQQHRPSPALLPKVAAKPGWDYWVDSLRKRPFANLREPGADICGKRTVDGDAGHAVTWVPEPLEIGLSFPFPLEGGRVAGLNVDTDNVPCVIVYRVP